MIGLIVLNTLREVVRDRLFVAATILFVVAMLVALAGAYVAVGDERRLIIDVGLAAMVLIGLPVSALCGAGSLGGEIERGTIDLLLSRPVTREQIVIGKFLGLSLALLLQGGAMLGLLTLTLALVSGNSWRGLIGLWAAGWLTLLQLLIVALLALFFSSFSTSRLSAMIAMMIFLVGRSSAELRQFAESSVPVTRLLFRALMVLIPDLARLNQLAAAGHGRPITFDMSVSATGYAIAWMVALLSATILVFRRRQIS